jgi:ABC-type multidrug transport system ATPase subunit
VDVAIGLVGDPEVLFLDEPTTGLDPAARRGMWALIEGLRRAGKTVFLTTHYMEEAQRLADRIVILQAGAIAAQGTAEQLSRALVPAAILAKTLGIHVQAAIQWQKISGGDWTAYAADISRRGHAQERARARIQHADPLPSA